MNNSLPRLIDGMIATLRREIIPSVEDDFSRGQAFGMIYMLNSIRLRASWSNGFLLEQIRALDEASGEIAIALADLPEAPKPSVAALAALPTAAELEARRDEGDARICELIDWLEARRETAPASALAGADAAIARYVKRQLKWDL